MLSQRTIKRCSPPYFSLPSHDLFLSNLPRPILILPRSILILPRSILILPRSILILPRSILILPRSILIQHLAFYSYLFLHYSYPPVFLSPNYWVKLALHSCQLSPGNFLALHVQFGVHYLGLTLLLRF
jgi:hypothetical protein